MIITVGDYKYNARGRTTYLAKDALQDILRRYYWLYAPSGYFAPDGSVSMVDSELEGDVDYDENDNATQRKVQRVLTDSESSAMINRARANPDYQAEVMDFHLTPIGNAPLLSQLIETHDPTPEEKAMIDSGVLFFYASGVGSAPKKNESTSDTQEPQKEKEVTIQQST